MLLRYCRNRSPVVLLLAAVIVLCGGHLKSFLAGISTSRGEDIEALVAETDSAATDVSNRSEPTSRHTGKRDDWVRTRTGWEHETKWFGATHYEPALHPAVVAALVSLVALWALVAFPADAAATAEDPDLPDTTFLSDS